MAQMGRAADKADIGKAASLGSADPINRLSEAVETLSMRLGKDLPEASRDAADSFHSDSSVMESAQRRIGGGFNFIRDALEKVNTIARQSKLQTFIQSIQLSVLKDIADGIGNIATAGRNLTIGLEAEMQQLSVTTRATGANFGFTGKALSAFSGRAAGMAKSLNVDANTAALSLRAWTEAGDELRAMGFKSAQEVARFSAAFGVNADVLRNSGLRMRKEFGMTDEQINQVIGSFTMMGQISGDVTAAMNDMPKMMDLLRRRASMMGKSLDSKDLASYAASTAALASGFMQVGQSSDQARESAMQISETMIKAKETFKGMFAGTQTDIDQFHKALGISVGDIGVAFDTMTQGPDEFLAGLAGMVRDAKRVGKDIDFTLLHGQMESVFGPDQAATLVNFFRSADDATLDLMKSVKKTPADLGKLGKEAHRTGRTLADSFELAKDSFVMSFRAIARKEARVFVSDTGKEFSKFNDQLRGLVERGGPLAAVISKFSELHQLGVMALLPKTLRPMAAVLGEILKEVTPMAGVLGSLGFRFNMLLSPLFLIAAALAVAIGWFAKLRMEGKSTDEALAIIATTVKEKFTQSVDFLGKQLERLKSFLPHVYDFVGGVWDTLIGGIDPGGAGKSRAAEWGEKIGSALRYAVTTAIAFVKNYIQEWWSTMGEIWSDGSKPFNQKLKETLGGSAGLIIGAFAIGKFTPIFGILSKLAGIMLPLAKGIGVVGKALFELVPGPWLIIGGLVALGTLMQKYPEEVNAVLGKIGEYVGRLMTLLVGTILPNALGGIAFVLYKLPGIFLSAFQAAVAAAFQVLDGMKDYLQQRFPKWFGAIEAAFFMLKSVAVAVIGFIFAKWAVASVKWVIGTIKAVATFIAQQYMAAAAAVKSAIRTGIAWATTMKEMIVYAYEWITVMLPLYVEAAAKAVWSATRTAAAWVVANATMIAGAVATAAGFVAAAVSASAAWIAAAVPVLLAWAPFIALAAAIGLAIVGVAYVVKKYWGPISGFFEALWDTIAAGVKWFAKIMKYWLLAPYYTAKAIWWGTVKMFGVIWEAIRATASWAWEQIGGVLTWPVDHVIKPAWAAIGDFFSSIWDAIGSTAMEAWDGVKSIILLPVKAIEAVWGGVKNFFSGVWDAVETGAGWVWDKIKIVVTAPIRWIESAWNRIEGFFGGIWDSVAGAAKRAWNTVSGAASSAWNSITGSALTNSKLVEQLAENMNQKLDQGQARASASAVGMSKGVQEQISSSADLARFKALEVSATYKGMTKTTGGEIVKAADAVVRYVQDAHGEVVKAVHAAKDLDYGRITGVEQYREAIKLQAEHNRQLEMLEKQGKGAGTKGWEEAMQKYGEASQQYRDQYGLSLQTIGLQGMAIEKSMSQAKDRIDKIRTTDMAAAIRFEQQREDLLNQVATRALWIEQNKHNMTREQQAKAYKDLEAMAANYNTQLETQIDISTGNWAQHWESVRFDAQKSADFMKMVARSTSDAWSLANQDIVASISAGNEEARSKTKLLLEDLKAAMEGEILAIQSTSNLSQTQIQAQVDATRQRYDEMAGALRQTVQDESLKLSSGLNDGLNTFITGTEEKMKTLIDKGKAATQDMQGEVQKLGFTSDEARGMLTEIANINTTTFKENLKVVKEEFLGLLAKLGEIQKGLIDLGPTSTKAFEEAQKALSKFWEEFDKRFAGSKNIAVIASEVFSKVLAAAMDMKSQLKGIFQDIFAEIGKYVQGIMKRIRVDSKVMAMELKTTAAAAYAATERTPAEQRALDEGRAPNVRTSFKKDTIEEGQRQLYEATHWPDWYTRDFAKLAESMKESLRSLDMKTSAATPGTSGRNIRPGVGGIGLNYQVDH